jgi:hypothetical protein
LHLEKEKRKRDVWEIDTPSKSTFYRSFYQEKSGTHPDRIEPKMSFVENNTVEQQVMQRLEQEKQKMHDESLAQLIETLKDPQHRAIKD